MSNCLSDLAYFYAQPSACAQFKEQPEHFIVREKLGWQYSGAGEHWMLKIGKTNENTHFVANELARFCGLKSFQVSWAGRKDRHAYTEQWFSIHLPKGDVNLQPFFDHYPQIQLLEQGRHHQKLRPGDLAGNTFTITLTGVTNVTEIEQKLQLILQQGVPNYYGPQRFGWQGQNVEDARKLADSRTRNKNNRGMLLSAARSWLFNHIVSQRINQNCYQSLIEGDLVFQQDDLVAITADNIQEMQTVVDNGKAHISAALAGDNQLPTTAAAEQLEQAILAQEPDLMKLLRANRMQQERRAITLQPQDLSWQWSSSDQLVLSFFLPAGSFATAVLRELIQ